MVAASSRTLQRYSATSRALRSWNANCISTESIPHGIVAGKVVHPSARVIYRTPFSYPSKAVHVKIAFHMISICCPKLILFNYDRVSCADVSSKLYSRNVHSTNESLHWAGTSLRTSGWVHLVHPEWNILAVGERNRALYGAFWASVSIFRS